MLVVSQECLSLVHTGQSSPDSSLFLLVRPNVEGEMGRYFKWFQELTSGKTLQRIVFTEIKLMI